jgi:hypothetical protein
MSKIIIPFVIHKTNLNYERTTIVVPQGTELLSVAGQRGIPVLWHKRPVASDKVVVKREIVGYMTGSEFLHMDKCSYVFIGTVLLEGGNFVIHYFEEIKNGR